MPEERFRKKRNLVDSTDEVSINDVYLSINKCLESIHKLELSDNLAESMRALALIRESKYTLDQFYKRMKSLKQNIESSRSNKSKQ